MSGCEGLERDEEGCGEVWSARQILLEAVTVNTKRILGALVALFVLAVWSICYSADLVLNNTPVKVLFNPGGRCAEAIVDEITNAKTDIFVQAYDFTSADIAEALLDAHKRGVKVEVIIDKGKKTGKKAQAPELANLKIPVYIPGKRTKAHNKIMIIDGTTVITGSFNFTTQAGKNTENLLIIKSGELAKLYRDNWDEQRQYSEPFVPED
jgi:phosphatidylserine/phosphatidylglycerophosphate/cardiolipin synthase-like enzyme